MTYADADGTWTWYADHGSGRPLVYLHGGRSDAHELDDTLPAYVRHFRVFTPERRGHGRTPDVAGPHSFAAYTDDVVGFLEAVVGGAAHLVGHGDGATVALGVAVRRPDLVRRLVCISGVFHHSAAHHDTAPPVDGGADPAEGTVPGKLAAARRTGPTFTVDDLARVAVRTLVMSGDDDLVPLDHTVALYRALPDAELAVVPGTSHVQYAEKPHAVTAAVLEFLVRDPVPTVVPIRRAGRKGQ